MAFNKSNRWYEINGEKYPSVTTILSIISKPALYAWHQKMGAKKVFDVLNMLKTGAPIVYDWVIGNLPSEFLKSGSDKMEEAANTGSLAHSIIEKIVKNESVDLTTCSDDARNAVSQFLSYQEKYPFQVIKAESVVYSLKYGYAGTMDALVKLPDGKVYINDWKTSNAIYPEMLLQASAYKQAVEEMTGEHVDGIQIVRFDKSGKLLDPEKDIVILNDTKKYFSVFLHAMELWKWANAN